MPLNKNESPEISIDFGTARVKVAYFDEKSGTPKLASIGRVVHHAIPSLFYVGEDFVEVGDAAAEWAEEDPKGLIVGLKRQIHRPGKIHLPGKHLQCGRVEIAAHMFRHIREKLEKEAFYKPVHRCVLTVPVCFEQGKREKLRMAAERGGFTTVALVEEPVSAGRAWLRHAAHHVEVDSVIICDIGGGTSDFALLKREGDGFVSDPRVIPCGHDMGGNDLDEAVAEVFQEENEIHYSKPYLLLKFRNIRERLPHYKDKIILKLGEQNAQLDPKCIQEQIDDFVDTVLELAQSYVEKCDVAGIGKETPLVLIGGGSRVNGLEERIRESTQRKVYCWADSDYAVVLGAVNMPQKKKKSIPKKPSGSEVYKAAVEAVWVDREISSEELAYLKEQRKKLKLSLIEAEDIEQAVCGETALALAGNAETKSIQNTEPESEHPKHLNDTEKIFFRRSSGPQEEKKWTADLGSGVEMEFVPIRAGSFQMGSNRTDEKPVHTVRLRQAYWLAKTEVTQAQYQQIMGTNPSRFKGSNNPVEQVSWKDAVSFCKKLTQREQQAGHLPTDFEYTLPTEAQWEYACRAGTTGKYFGNLDSMVWYDKNSGKKTHPVGTKQANAWGLYDMHGNVWEWCSDWYDGGTYKSGSVTDPRGASSGSNRVGRGGSWRNSSSYCRSANRRYDGPSDTSDFLGFRACLVRK